MPGNSQSQFGQIFPELLSESIPIRHTAQKSMNTFALGMSRAGAPM